MSLNAPRALTLGGMIVVSLVLFGYLSVLDRRGERLAERMEEFKTLRENYIRLEEKQKSRQELQPEPVDDPLSYIEEKTSAYDVAAISPLSGRNDDQRRFRLNLRSVSISVPFELLKAFSEETIMSVKSFRIERVSRDLKKFDVFFVLQK